jgi:peptidoglycan hydrolase-like protein with peptidoglycan-binding domain
VTPFRAALTVTALVAVAGAVGAWAGSTLVGSSPARASRPGVPVATALVHRQDLVVTDLVDGAIGYRPGPPMVNRLAGTYTALPAEGAVVRRGQALYRVDGDPVVLLYGGQPAWRAFAAGMHDGPDVAELEANLAALGFARGLFRTADGHFDWATSAAVRRWQRALGFVPTVTVELGRVVFLPGPVRVGLHQTAASARAAPGDRPYIATSSTRVVTVALSASRQGEARVGAKVSIDLPGGRTTPGTIAHLGQVAAAAPATDGNARGGAEPTVALTVVPDHPAATGRLDQEPVQVELLTTLGGTIAAGRFLSGASVSYPTVVLGSATARQLGVDRADGTTQLRRRCCRCSAVSAASPSGPC